MSDLPGTFTRAQVLAAFDALGLGDDNEMVASLTITGTQIDVELFVPDDDGGVMHMLGELATVVIQIPVDEDDN